MRAPLFYKRRFCNETPVSAARVVGNKLVYLPRDARAAVMSVETIGTRAGEVEGKLDCTRCTFVYAIYIVPRFSGLNMIAFERFRGRVI